MRSFIHAYQEEGFLAAAATGLGLLTGCVSRQVDDHSFQFNEATGSLGMRLLLLNAVRASKDYPLQFSKISTYQGRGAMGSASLSASLPLNIPSAGSMSPKVDWNDGISRIDLIDLNTEEAQEALKKPLTYNGYAYHTAFSGNRSSILPHFLLVEQISMSTRLYLEIKESVACTCALVENKACDPSIVKKSDADLQKLLPENRRRTREALERNEVKLENGEIQKNEHARTEDKIRKEYQQYERTVAKLKEDRSKFIEDLKRGKESFVEELKYSCDSLQRLKNECHGVAETLPLTMDQKVALKNDLTTQCKHKGFMYGLLQLKIAGVQPKSKPSKDDKPDEADKPETSGADRTRTETKGGNTFIYTVEQKEKTKEEEVTISVLNRVFAARCVGSRLCDLVPTAPPALNREEISFLLRSPERMVRYLGDLISAQNYGSEPFVPGLLDPERQGKWFTLLTVKRGPTLPGGAAVSIADPEGTTFYVPQRSHDSPKTDLSLETFAIVTDVLNAAVSKKAVPPVTTLAVASP